MSQFLKLFFMVYLSISKIEIAEIIISLPVVLARNCMVNQLYVLPVFECYWQLEGFFKLVFLFLAKGIWNKKYNLSQFFCFVCLFVWLVFFFNGRICYHNLPVLGQLLYLFFFSYLQDDGL